MFTLPVSSGVSKTDGSATQEVWRSTGVFLAFLSVISDFLFFATGVLYISDIPAKNKMFSNASRFNRKEKKERKRENNFLSFVLVHTQTHVFTGQVLIHFHVLFENCSIGNQPWCSASWLDNLSTVSSAQKDGSWWICMSCAGIVFNFFCRCLKENKGHFQVKTKVPTCWT